MGKVTSFFLVFGILSALTVYFVFPDWITDPEPPKIEDFEWWGRGAAPAGAEKAPIVSKPFKIQVKETEIADLKRRLSSTRYSEPLENSNFNYGFPATELKKVVDYWATKYDWALQEKALNKYNHYKAKIEGIEVHYMRVTPKVDKNIKVIPLLMIHGWPGSFAEFMKIIPLLTTPNAKQDFVFDVICPSIPGYGYSEAPHKMGFNALSAARIFSKLMSSLKLDNYYVQGGDWGSFIATNMARFYPKQVRGVQLNLVALLKFSGLRYIANLILGSTNKNWVLDEGQTKSIFPVLEFFGNIMLESGYFHIQATKPDTVGSALSDSPAGLAAYILEKFSTWTNNENRDLSDGGLKKKFNLDDLLTNVMIYWTTNSITSSQRFYKENMKQKFRALQLDSLPVKVPAGLSVFANDLMAPNKCMARDIFRDIVLFRHHKDGGHFAALEEPQILAKDVVDFVRENENRAKETSKETQNKKK